MISYTQNLEDVLLERCFRDLAEGFYVDIGACHPTASSITRWFYDRGWSGINIEPGEGIEDFRRERPRDVNIEAAIADFQGRTKFFVHTANPGTSTLSANSPTIVTEKAGDIREQDVAVTTLSAVIDEHAVGKHIHFLKIDAEGAENAIISAADWQRYRPEVILIESTEPYTTVRRHEPWQTRLDRNGYRMVYFDGINDFWLREESLHLQKHFSLPVNVLDGYEMYNPAYEGLKASYAALAAENAALRQARASRSLLKNSF